MRKFIFILCLFFALNAYAIPPSGDTFKVKSDATDTSPDYLDAKLAGGIGDDLLIEDDKSIEFGTGQDYSTGYDSANTRLEVRTSDSDGGGTDKDLIHIEDGGDDIALFGSTSITKNQNAPTALTITNTTDGIDSAGLTLCAGGSNAGYFGTFSDSYTTVSPAAGRTGILSLSSAGSILYNSAGNFKFCEDTDLAAGNMFNFDVTSGSQLTDTDAEQSYVSFNADIAQSGTANYIGLEVDVTETSTGSGVNELMALRIAGADKFTVSNTGATTCGPAAADGYVELLSASAVPAANDNWRLAQDSDDLVFQRMESAAWVTNFEVSADGVFFFPETTTPTAVTNYGAIYTKSDNIPYFQDGAGVEKTIQTGSIDYGEMGNVYGSSATEIIPSANEWRAMNHANITGSVPHLNTGFSFVAGKEGSGTTTTAQGGSAINISDVAHGLLDDDIVTVQSANHVGVGTVVYVDADNFEIDIAYVGDEAITWQMGSYLLVATADVYRGAWNASFSQSTNNTQTSIISPFVNTTQSTKATASRLLTNNTDVGSIGGNGIMSFSVGDRIWFACQTTTAQTLTFTIRNVSIH